MKKIMLLMLPLILAAISFYKFSPKKETQFTAAVTVSGWITDETGTALAYASVKEKGSANKAKADARGFYSIVVTHQNTRLLFEAPGYAPLEKSTNGNRTLNVMLSVANEPKKDRAVDEIRISNMETNTGKSLMGRMPGIAMSPSHGYYPNDDEGYHTEDYDFIKENGFLKTTDNPLSTFSIDVDAASYSNVRRMLKQGQLPPAGAVRIEEMINYFPYNYPQPLDDAPFSFTTEMSNAPWNPEHKLVMIGMQGKKVSAEKLPASNLVFLIDVSGSMMGPTRLDLVKASMKLLTDQLREQDKVSIVVYAGAAGMVLAPTSGSEKSSIKNALDQLEAGGSTAGGAGIQLAYTIARNNFIKNGNNRVILCTDGDFNVGVSSSDELERMIEKERKSGVFLTVLGYGMGNYKDNKMQKLADKGNGNHAYIDGLHEAKKVLVNEFGGTLFAIAKDVKLQVEFNPIKVQGYRLIGYENRMLNKEDFNDDKKDAGEMGSGHTVTALYEIIPTGTHSTFIKDVDDLKYKTATGQHMGPIPFTDEVMNIKFRYKAPDGDVSKLLVHPVKDKAVKYENASGNYRFATAVAAFGMLLRESEFKGNASYALVQQWAQQALGIDKEGYRAEFVNLVKTAAAIALQNKTSNKELTESR